MTEPTVTESWQSIVEWLAQHVPAMRAAVRPPATEAELTRAEQELGIPLPDDLLEWWRLADGLEYEAAAGRLLMFYSPLHVADALLERADWLEGRGDATAQALADGRSDPTLDPAGTECYHNWLPTWIPIAYDGSGDDLFVDLRPGPQHGCVMEFDNVECASQKPFWPSVRAMLAEIAKALNEDVAIGPYSERPYLTEEGHLAWDLDGQRP